MSTGEGSLDPARVGLASSVVDGILHNLARKQRRGYLHPEQSSDLIAGHGEPDILTSSRQQEVEASGEAEEFQVHEKNSGKLKGILKVPTVRFSADTEWPERLLEESRRDHAFPPFAVPPPPPPFYESQQSTSPGVSSSWLMPPPPPPPPPPVAPPPPSLFSKQIELDEYLSEAAYKLYTQFFDDLSDFVQQQTKVVALRLNVQEKRAELKRLREDVSRCDVNFITAVRNSAAAERSLDNPEVMAHFESAQQARDLVGPVEAEYEPLEVGLGAEEHKLKEMYSQLELRFEHFFRLTADSSSQHSLPTKIVYEDTTEASSGSGNEVQQFIEPRDVAPFHGAWIGEQVAVGQAPVRVEQTIAETVQSRERDKKRLTSSSEDHSRRHLSSVTAEEGIKDEVAVDLTGIAGAEEFDVVQIENVRAGTDAMPQGLAGLFAETSFDTTFDSAALEDDLGPNSLLEQAEDLLLSILPPDHDSTIPDFLRTFGYQQKILQEFLTEFENTRDRVSRWICHQLRLSRREILGLKREVTESAPGIEDWAEMAMELWASDTLGQEQLYIRGSIEGTSDVAPLLDFSY